VDFYARDNVRIRPSSGKCSSLIETQQT